MAMYQFVTSNPPIGDYINGVNSGYYDIDPPHQRNSGRNSTKWNIDVIRHVYQFQTLTPIYYHKRKSDGVCENLDGKQRTHALRLYINGELSIPISSGLPPHLCGKYTELSLVHQRMFYSIPVILLISNIEMTSVDIKTFFNDVQKSSTTQPGERINSDPDNKLNRMIVRELEINEILKKICTIPDMRMENRYTLALCTYIYCNGITTKRVPGPDTVIDFGSHFNDTKKFREAMEICEAVSIWMHMCKIRQTRWDFMAFFILFWKSDDAMVDRIMRNIKSLEDPSKPFEGYHHKHSGGGTCDRSNFLIEKYNV
jgi:hypothetical protein